MFEPRISSSFGGNGGQDQGRFIPNIPPPTQHGASAGYSEDVQFYNENFADPLSGGGNNGGIHSGGPGSFSPSFESFEGEIGGGSDSLQSGHSGGGAGGGSRSGFLLEDEPPLLEELGIDLTAILQQTKNICFPTSLRLKPGTESNADLAGPLLFCLLLGSALLLRGKVHFGYIYGLGVTGCVGVWMVLNLMSLDQGSISFDQTSSILGYSLLPIVVLAFMTLVMDLTGPLGLLVMGIYVSWCTFSATRFIEQHMNMRNQRWLVAYPVWLLYAVFALVTVF